MPKTKKQPINKVKDNELTIPEDKLYNYIQSSLDNMKQKQEVMLKTYNFGRKIINSYFILIIKNFIYLIKQRRSFF